MLRFLHTNLHTDLHMKTAPTIRERMAGALFYFTAFTMSATSSRVA